MVRLLIKRLLSKKGVVLIIIVGLITIAAVLIWSYLNSGKVTIKAPDPINSNIRITQIDGNSSEKKAVIEGSGEISTKLDQGLYEVFVYGKGESMAKVIQVNARHDLSYELDPPESFSYEPVADVAGYSANIYNNELIYVNRLDNLFLLKASGEKRILNSSDFYSVKWSRDGLGLAWADTSFYWIRGSQLRKINLPEHVSKQSHVQLSVAGSGRGYISVGSNVYVVNEDNEARKIYTSNLQSPFIFAGKSRLAMLELPKEPPKNASESDKVTSESLEPSVLELVGTSGNLILKEGLYGAHIDWSPSGGKAAVMSSVDLRAYIYDEDLGKITNFIPINDPEEVYWIDDDNLLVVSENILWGYSLTNNEAYTITTMASGTNISNLFVDATGKTAYFLADQRDKRTLMKVRLNDRAYIPKNIALSVVFPKDVGICHINYVNLAKPTILITHPATKHNQGEPSEGCLNTAKNELVKYSLNPKDFTYRTFVFHGD